jgi:hypothetical protein
LTCTDLNTKFFHASTVSQRKYNSISSLKSLDGILISGRENIGPFLVHHFSSIFSTTNHALDSDLNELVGKVVTDEKNVIICGILDEAKIFLAISNLGLNKAPGSDGITSLFYKSYWPIVKSSVISSVQSFFRGVLC